jgi:hypothetical protein
LLALFFLLAFVPSPQTSSHPADPNSSLASAQSATPSPTAFSGKQRGAPQLHSNSDGPQAVVVSENGIISFKFSILPQNPKCLN